MNSLGRAAARFACIAVLTLISTPAACGMAVRSGDEKATSNAERARPNIILLLADDLGYSDISSYRPGDLAASHPISTSQTPNIDRMAAEGIRFTHFYAGAAVCSPSRAALLTGRNATRVGIYNWIPPAPPMHLRTEEVTLPEMLRPLGYRRAHFGKWHLSSTGSPPPEAHGFESALYTSNNAHPSHRNPDNFLSGGRPVGKIEGYSSQIVVDKALEWLEGRHAQGEPFFLNLWFHEPHTPVAAPPELASRHPRRGDYYGCIENMDRAIGRLLDYLKAKALDDNTLVLFTSDNGSQVLGSNEPFRGAKCFNYEGGIRVPFVLRWPGVVPAGSTSDYPASFVDILPTLAAVVSADLPSDRVLDGESLAPILSSPAAERSRESPIFFYRYFHDPILMLRTGDWILLGYEKEPPPYAENYNPKERALFKPEPGEPEWSQWSFQSSHMRHVQVQEPSFYELYNIREDPAQRHDLAQKLPERVTAMKSVMLTLKKECLAEGGDWFSR